ncbi:MAG: magnesium transporter, partial [Methermicoccaceae archaeon]
LGMIGALLFLSMLIFPVIGGLTHIIAISIGFSSPGFLELITLCGIAGLVATTLSVIIAYYSNYLSLRYGVDPDSIVIPVIASLMDLMGTIMVIGAMIILLL